MPEPTEQTQEQLDLNQTPIQNVEDPNKVDELFRKAAKTLEYDTEPDQTSLPTPEEELENIPKEEKPHKPAKKKAKAPESEPEPEKPAEPEKKLSKREQFKQTADAEKAYREKEAKLKEREAEIHRIELAMREFNADPIAYLEKMNPRAYEEWTERNLAGGKPTEKSEITELKKMVEKLSEELNNKHQETTSQVQLEKDLRYISDTKNILSGEEYADVFRAAEILGDVHGKPVDMGMAIASAYDEFKMKYGKELTQQECCEILLEDAQAFLERLPTSEKIRALYGTEKPADKPPKKKPTPGRTLTNEQETSSQPSGDVDLSHIKTKEELLVEAAKLIEYAEE